jgi:hypothetical protein
MTERAFLIKWILASGAGMALGFLMFINILFFLAFGFEFDTSGLADGLPIPTWISSPNRSPLGRSNGRRETSRSCVVVAPLRVRILTVRQSLQNTKARNDSLTGITA